MIQFIERDAKRVEALRVKYWPTKNGKGPVLTQNRPLTGHGRTP